jgi:predicted HTH domain antitoxin
MGSFSLLRFRYIPGMRGYMNDIKINDKHKDRLFRFLFGNEEYKEYALSLYNAVNDTDYQDVNDITFYTIDDVIYIKRKNDVAVLLDSKLSLWEHQSSFNPNMPIRGLMYFGQMYDKYISLEEQNIFGRKLIRIPTPKYCVFYNGNEDLPGVMKLKLSDAFAESDDSGEFEWTATMYNLNSGKNDLLLDKCRTLSDYMTFVNKVKENRLSGMDKTVAVDKAVTDCIAGGILKNVLLKHRSEVASMVLTEFNEEVYKKGIYEEGFAEGKTETILLFCKNGKISLKDASEMLNLPVSEVEKMMTDTEKLS